MSEKATILIIDDELGPRESLRMILKPHYQTITAREGRSALEIICKQAVDVVTLDLKMPGMSGIEILKAIKHYDPHIEIIIITGYGTVKSAIEAIRHGVVDYILKPFNVFEILPAIDKALERRKLGMLLRSRLPLRRDPGSIDELWASVAEEISPPGGSAASDGAQESRRERYLDFLKVLAVTLENKDEYTHGHAGRVTYYSNLIADRLKMDDEEKKHLQIAAFLHDIGKLGVSNSIVGKEDRLNPQEKALLQEHPEKGVSLIEPLNIPQDIMDIIKHHHERFDGQGYPHGLKGEEIPLGARIVALADAYDAMSSHRPYRAALSREAISRELVRCSGTQFCPYITRIFLEIIEGELLIDYQDINPPTVAAASMSGREAS